MSSVGHSGYSGQPPVPRCLTAQLFAVKLSLMEDDRSTDFQIVLDASGSLPPMDPMRWDWPTGLFEEHRVDITALMARDGTLHQGRCRGTLSEPFDRCMDRVVEDFGEATDGQAVGVTVYWAHRSRPSIDRPPDPVGAIGSVLQN